MGNVIPGIKLRGIRQVVPPGYVLGRLGNSQGDVQLVPISGLGAHMQQVGAMPKPPVLHPTYGLYGAGLFAANEQLPPAPAPQKVIFPSADSGETSTVTCTGAPAGNVQFVLAFNVAAYLAGGYPAGCVAKCNILTGQLTGTVTYAASSYTLAQGGLLTLVMPSPADGSLAGVAALFIGDPG